MPFRQWALLLMLNASACYNEKEISILKDYQSKKTTAPWKIRYGFLFENEEDIPFETDDQDLPLEKEKSN